MKRLTIWLFCLLPKNLLSRWFGAFARILWPWPLRSMVIRGFAVLVGANVSEAEKPLGEYQSLAEFFTRHLRWGVRPLGPNMVHPVDARWIHAGTIHQQQLIQAKGLSYSLEDLLLGQEGQRLDRAKYCTYHLRPKDYHRVHAPADLKVMGWRHIPGRLWPVNRPFVEAFPNLYRANERVIVFAECQAEPMVIVFIGAFNVGSVELSFDPELKTNAAQLREVKESLYSRPKPFEKGHELGVFHLGSSIVMISPHLRVRQFQPKEIQMGQEIL